MKTQNRAEEIIPIEKVTTFYAVAYKSFLQVERLVNERVRYERNVEKEKRKWTEDDLDFLIRNRLTRADEERLVVVTIIFSALALEALINDYMIFNSSKSFLENYLDSLSPRSKWLIFPWMFKGKSMRTEGQTFQRLAELFTLRNELVHFKSPRKSAGNSGEKSLYLKDDATDAIRSVREAVTELKRLDRRVSTLWLRETEKASTE